MTAIFRKLGIAPADTEHRRVQAVADLPAPPTIADDEPDEETRRAPRVVEIAAAERRQAAALWPSERAALLRVAELVAQAAHRRRRLRRGGDGGRRPARGQATTLTRFDGDARARRRRRRTRALHRSGRASRSSPTRCPTGFCDRPRSSASTTTPEQPDAGLAASFGLAAAVSAPVTVAGEVWGMLTATSAHRPLPRDTGRPSRAVRAARRRRAGQQPGTQRPRSLAAEQAALRRVAELVARGTASDEVFVAVTNEASALLGDLAVALMLYDDTGADGRRHLQLPGARRASTCRSAPVRPSISCSAPAGPPTSTPTRARRWRTSPGRSASPRPPPSRSRWRAGCGPRSSRATPGPTTRDAVEARLTQFAELAAVAIANAETRRSSPPPGPASSPPPTRPADASSATSTTARSSGSCTRSSRSSSPETPWPSGSSATDLVEEALANAERANSELRDLVHGILPAVAHSRRPARRTRVARRRPRVPGRRRASPRRACPPRRRPPPTSSSPRH